MEGGVGLWFLFTVSPRSHAHNPCLPLQVRSITTDARPQDLSIRNEGRYELVTPPALLVLTNSPPSYSLRFRCFDMTAIGSASNSDPIPPLVECQSADFKVYSPRK